MYVLRVRALVVGTIALFASSGATATALHAQAVVEGRLVDRLFSDGPLAGALVQLEGEPHSATTDSVGRFRFSGLSAGRYMALVSHPRFEAIGLQLPALELDVSDSSTSVTLQTPTGNELFAQICPRAENSGPLSGGAILRTRNADDGQPWRGVTVRVEWKETQLSAGTRLSYQVIPHLQTATSDEQGRAIVCGIPRGVPVTISAEDGVRSAGPVVDSTSASGWLAGELTLGRSVSGSVALGQIVGADGAVIPGAQVRIAGSQIVSTADSNGFRLPVAAGGTRTLEIRAIGYASMTQRVSLLNGTTRLAPIVLEKVPYQLAELSVAADATGFERRRRGTIGQFLTAADIARLQPKQSEDIVRLATGAIMPQGFARPSYVLLKGGRCSPRIFFDGREIDGADGDLPLKFDPQDIRGVEIYDNSQAIPPTIVAQLTLRESPYAFLERTRCAVFYWSWFSGGR